ncbi:MAG: MFS transporter [Clostridia bacterium]|nr:MFS transporter [Clostridia bacterium]
MNRKLQSAMTTLREMRTYLILWVTQAFSGLGSGMTSYALLIWSYTQEGKALTTALLGVASYAPYVVCSIFAGALSDRWDKRRTMLVCDMLAALTTLCTLVLLKLELLQVWHLYLLNAINGLMNTVQGPASEVATTALLPRKHYQKVGGLNQLSGSLNGILTPVLAMAVMGFAGMDGVILFDLITFAVAFLVLLVFIRIPEGEKADKPKEPMMQSVKEGLAFLKEKRGIFMLILFLAAINFVASMFNAALPAMVLSRNGGSETALGVINTFTAVTTLIGSLIAAALPAPKSRVRVICWTLLLSMSTENFLLGFGRSLPVWCIAAFLGWIAIPLMNTNLGALMRLNIPQSIQGRVYAARNSLQFFTIPLGYMLGGAAVDYVFEPLMARQTADSLLVRFFGMGKGSGAACFFAVLGVLGVLVCVIFRRDKHIRAMQAEELKA